MKTAKSAARSLRILAAINRLQAMRANRAGQPQLADHYAAAARDYRASAGRIARYAPSDTAVSAH